MNRHGRNYNVKVTVGKRGDSVGSYRVFAADVKVARKLATDQAMQDFTGDRADLHAHGPTRAD